ncbi:hypothetical protein B296_00024958 [Ensete ventricosum]|uniref:Uncharacterized protein n=1 Tax=Ensete ventricosum TaxID=4639 RepID=A0A426XQQ7_ENSVE|nr:hypothetical protein B296_00024958 [Ensete ventricosum]
MSTGESPFSVTFGIEAVTAQGNLSHSSGREFRRGILETRLAEEPRSPRRRESLGTSMNPRVSKNRCQTL